MKRNFEKKKWKQFVVAENISRRHSKLYLVFSMFFRDFSLFFKKIVFFKVVWLLLWFLCFSCVISAFYLSFFRFFFFIRLKWIEIFIRYKL